MVAEDVLPFQYEEQRVAGSMTALAGLPAYFELAAVAGVRESLGRHLGGGPGGQGWTGAQVALALLLVNLVGGDAVEDVDRLESDEGLGRVMRQVEHHGLPRKDRRALERRWRKERTRAFPSVSAARRWLAAQHNEAEEARRVAGEAFIPERLESVRGLSRVNADLVAFVQDKRPCAEATLDMDATLVASHKQEALYCYKKFKAYQPLNTWWAEQQLVVHSEFRDGNVPAGFDQLRVFEEALGYLPAGVEKVRTRSDTAGYQWDFLRYCEEGRHPRFGRIEFAVGVDITDAFRLAVATTPDLRWQPLGDNSGQEWAEVSYVPQGVSRTLKGSYRFIAVREPVRQMSLFPDTQQFSFPTLRSTGEAGQTQIWKLSAVVTNRMEMDAVAVIHWYRGRCGKSEEAHSIMKEDLAGGRLPSKRFGANAAWWLVMILAMNLHAAMKLLVLDDSWMTRRMKAVRLWFIAVPALVIRHARTLTLRLGAHAASGRLLIEARARIADLARGPAG